MGLSILPGMTLRQHAHLPSFLNSKPSWSIRPLKILETIDWNSRSSRCKLQKPRLLFCIPRANTLPKVLDNFIVFGVTTVISVLFPVIHVDISDTADEEFELAFIKNVDEIWRDEFVEAGYESVKLFVDALLNPPFGY
jgi:hypothetical protein